MRRRVLALLLLAVAGGVWYGVVAPAREARDRARAEYALARQRREQLRTRLADLERRTRRAAAPEDAAAAGRALRLVLLRATEGLPLEAVQIAATGEARGVGARGRLSAEGRLAELLRVADRLAESGSGFRIERLRLSGIGDSRRRRRLEIEGLNEKAGS